MSKLFSITVIFLLLATANTYAAPSYAAEWQKGNGYYEQKRYDSAAYHFEQIAALKPLDAPVYYNLGNAYYRLNKVSLAILNYQRALRIDPDYAAAKDNLLLAQSRISNAVPSAGDIFFVEWWHSMTRPDRANMLAIITLILFVSFILLLLANQLRKKGSKRLPPQIAGFVFFVFICFLTVAFFAAKNGVAHDSGVVMQADVPLMNSELKGKPLVLIPEGTTVRIEEEKGDWLVVSLPDGRKGLIQAITISKI